LASFRWQAGLSGGSRRSSGFSLFAAFGQSRLTLEVAHLFFECVLEVTRGFAEFRHEFAKAAGEFGQLLRPENYERDDEDDNQMRDAKH
jgi:hypothetical protein